jgi:hypothetical protein
MPKDANAKLQKAINKKLVEARDWREAARKAKRLGDHSLAAILEGKASKADADRLNLQSKMK